MYVILTKKFIKQIKENWKLITIVMCTILIMVVEHNIFINKLMIPDKDISFREKYPIEHWISMGLSGAGGYNGNFVKEMRSANTYKERQEIARQQIEKLLSSYDANSFIKHLNKKLKYAWTDGTYFASDKVERQPVNRTILHEFVLKDGKYVKYYKYIPQVMHMSMLIFILIGVINIINNKDFKNKNNIIYICMLGFIVFLLIWENRSRYVLTGLPFFMLAQLEGIEIICKNKELENKNIKLYQNEEK